MSIYNETIAYAIEYPEPTIVISVMMGILFAVVGLLILMKGGSKKMPKKKTDDELEDDYPDEDEEEDDEEFLKELDGKKSKKSKNKEVIEDETDEEIEEIKVRLEKLTKAITLNQKYIKKIWDRVKENAENIALIVDKR